MKINTANWKEFPLNNLFLISGVKPTPPEVLDEWGKGIYPYITTSSKNNGAEEFYDHYTQEGNVLTVESAARGHCFYQPLPFSANGHVEQLKPLFRMTYPLAMFFVTLINMDCQYFTYGRKCKKENINKKVLRLPVVQYNGLPVIDEKHLYGEYIPDWAYMENYIKSLRYKPFKSAAKETVTLRKKHWRWFPLEEIFIITKGKRLINEQCNPGNTRFVSGTAQNNGVSKYIDRKPIGKANTITISYNGNVGEAFYQEQPYWYSDDVCSLESRFPAFNKYHALFICTILRKEKEKYTYGNKWTLSKMQKTNILLPCKDQVPDYEYMEYYMKSKYFSEKI